MRVLLWISILAFAVLLWASVAVTRHIYKVRQHRRNVLSGAATETKIER
jgi:hypothetical protein